jgi:hypothetical protein
MEYLYLLANASLTLRVVQYLQANQKLPIKFITVIHLLNGWIVKVKMNQPLNQNQDGNFKAFLNELGIPYSPSRRLAMALHNLEAGKSLDYVVRNHQVAVVSHGNPSNKEIEDFCQQFIRGLGYRPETLA